MARQVTVCPDTHPQPEESKAREGTTGYSTMASLTPAQLAAATPVDASKPTQSLPCSDAPRGSRAGGGALAGTQPTLDHARVYTHAGEPLKDKQA